MASLSALAAARNCLQCARSVRVPVPASAARRGLSTSAAASQQQQAKLQQQQQQSRKLATMVDAPSQSRSSRPTPPASSPSAFQSQQQQGSTGTDAHLDSEGFDITASRLTAPLKLTGLFKQKGHDHFDVTPEIGTEFPKGQIDMAAILAKEDSPERDEIIRELASMSECDP